MCVRIMERTFLSIKRRCRNIFGLILLVCLILPAVMYLFKQSSVSTGLRNVSYLISETTTEMPASIQSYLNMSAKGTNHKQDKSAGNCSGYLGPSPADDLAKIDSIRFDGIEQYTKNLFPPVARDPDPPELPVFVTALSSDHYAESLFLLKHLKETVRVKYKDLKVIVYDLGLTSKEAKGIKDICSCEMRKFQFDSYPKHFRILKNYSWKPLVIQAVAKEHPLVFWLDASVRFKTSDLDPLISDVKKYGLMADDTGRRSTGTITERTHNATFNFMQESPCTYEDHGEKHTGLVLVFANQLITKYFLRPWVLCALSFGCMEPIVNSKTVLRCPGNRIPHKYHLCHRFDQTILGILYIRLFHREMNYHKINRKYFMFCRFPGMNEHCENA